MFFGTFNGTPFAFNGIEIKRSNFMNANPFNICPSCAYLSTCVLTKSKEKVWSCSEYNEVKCNEDVQKEVETEKQEVEFV
ncbi:hypothetical protein [uncultured Tenacibaculum sp.]|uniref:hypothetical protein n=1 Tax=uncultured Tenacibaculum sp. TaxID=174713 RepID=UPI00260313A3|nr:hypothetical protein [uncultured Tenacibaculum sp.]